MNDNTRFNKTVTAEEVARKLDAEMRRQAEHDAQRVAKPAPTFEYIPPMEPAAPVCEFCNGLGCYKYNVPYTHELFGKLFPCPRCELGQVPMRRRQERLFGQDGLPKEYRHFKLRHFMPRAAWYDGLPDELINGKRLAIAMAWQFVHTPGHWMSEREAYRRWHDYYLLSNRRIPKIWEDKTAGGDETYRSWLVLRGLNGTGKTALASAISNELILKGIQSLYIRVDDFIQKAQATNNPDSDEVKIEHLTEMEVVNTARDTAVLVLDDMNVSKVSEYGLKIMEMVIRYRANHNKPTIITLNDDELKFQKQWGDRIASVVFGAAHWTPVDGPALRDERHSLESF